MSGNCHGVIYKYNSNGWLIATTRSSTSTTVSSVADAIAGPPQEEGDEHRTTSSPSTSSTLTQRSDVETETGSHAGVGISESSETPATTSAMIITKPSGTFFRDYMLHFRTIVKIILYSFLLFFFRNGRKLEYETCNARQARREEEEINSRILSSDSSHVLYFRHRTLHTTRPLRFVFINSVNSNFYFASSSTSFVFLLPVVDTRTHTHTHTHTHSLSSSKSFNINPLPFIYRSPYTASDAAAYIVHVR